MRVPCADCGAPVSVVYSNHPPRRCPACIRETRERVHRIGALLAGFYLMHLGAGIANGEPT